MATTRSAFRLRRLLCVVALLGLVAAACSNASNNTATGDSSTTTAGSGGTAGGPNTSPGVSSGEIDFSALGTDSNNPLGTCVLSCYLDGVNAYFAWRNSQGGIYGRKLVVPKADVYDDQLSQNQAKALQIISANDTFATFSAAELATGWGNLSRAGIPVYQWAIHPETASGLMNNFGHREVACIDCTARYVAYLAQLAHATKVAALGYGIEQDSKDCADGAKASLEKYGSDVGGAKVVYLNDGLGFGLPNGIGPEVSAMKAAGVQMIIGCLDLNAMKKIAQELHRQGMANVVLVHPNTYDQAFVKAAGDLFEGDLVEAGFRPFEADPGDSSLATYKEWMAKANKPLSEIAMVGWINADEAFQGLRAAGPNFTRQSVVDATNKMTNYTANGLIQPIDWSRQHVAPTEADPATHGPKYDCMSLVKVDSSGTFQMVADKATPWFCWPGDTRDWSEPKQMNFK
jgi:ABC-type branched-subunit amino acid transport system substrate-binding protein